MLNVVVLMGRLVADPQLRQTTTGKNVLRSALPVTVGAAMPMARTRPTSLMLSPGTAPLSLSAVISRKVP